MNSARQRNERLLPGDLLLMALVFALPLMKPAISGEIITADVLFIMLVATVAVEIVAGIRRVRRIRELWVLLAFVASLVPSLLATSDMRASLFKLATEFYLIGLTALTAWIVESEAKFRRVVLWWLAATALVSLDSVLSLLAFVSGQASWLLHYSSFIFGSLPPGDYPRLDLTFFNANMACNYLTISLGLAFVARALGYIDGSRCWLLIAGIAIASLSTVSPGLGGIAVLAAIWIWFTRRYDSPAIAKSALGAGVLVGGFFILALALTPFAHSTAPFLLRLPAGLTVYPSSRYLTWSAAFEQFLAHPLIGVGIGIDPIHVGFANPSGFQVLSDAHNVFLNIAAQCGIIGMIGVAALICVAIVEMRSRAAPGTSAIPRFLLGATFLDVFVYEGLGGSFEDTRHIWVLFGLVLAAGRIEFSRVDEKSRKAGAPSPC